MEQGHQWDGVKHLDPHKPDFTRDAADSASMLGGGWHLPTFTGQDSRDVMHSVPLTSDMAQRAAAHYGYGHKN